MQRSALAAWSAVVILAAVTALSACAQLAGIGTTTAGGDDDDDEPTSSLSLERVSIGATVVTTPQSIDGLPLPTFLTGDEELTGMATGSNEWTADAPSTGVLFQLPTLPELPAVIARLVALPVSTIDLPFPVLERPGAMAPPAVATVSVELTLPPLGTGIGAASYRLVDVGAWTSAVLPFGGSGSEIDDTLEYSSFTPQSPDGLLAIGSDDAILALQYTGQELTAAADLPGFDQTGSDTITGTLVALGGASELNETVHGPDGTARLGLAMPAPTGAITSAWSLTAAPGWQLSSIAGPTLDADTGQGSDTSVIASYDNPFEATHGWHTLFAWTLTGTRPFIPASGTFGGVTLVAQSQLSTIREPGDGSGSAAEDAALDASMPVAITLGTTPLVTDGAEITEDPTTALPVSFTTDGAGPGDTLYEVDVLEIVTGSGGAPSVATVFSYQGTLPSFTLPPDTLLAGHLYSLRAVSLVTSLPGLGDGELSPGGAPPTSTASTDSAFFSIGAAQ